MRSLPKRGYQMAWCIAEDFRVRNLALTFGVPRYRILTQKCAVSLFYGKYVGPVQYHYNLGISSFIEHDVTVSLSARRLLLFSLYSSNCRRQLSRDSDPANPSHIKMEVLEKICSTTRITNSNIHSAPAC